MSINKQPINNMEMRSEIYAPTDRSTIILGVPMPTFCHKKYGYTMAGSIMKESGVPKRDLLAHKSPSTMVNKKIARVPKWTVTKSDNGTIQPSDIFKAIEIESIRDDIPIDQIEKNLIQICINKGIILSFFGKYKHNTITA